MALRIEGRESIQTVADGIHGEPRLLQSVRQVLVDNGVILGEKDAGCTLATLGLGASC